MTTPHAFHSYAIQIGRGVWLGDMYRFVCKGCGEMG